MTIGLQGNVIKASQYVNIRMDETDLWPHGVGGDRAGGNKNVLTNGYHPVLAAFLRADRATLWQVGVVGVVTEYNSDLGTLGLNIAKGTLVQAEVYNVLTYSAGNPATFVTSLAARRAVYIDDSPDLGLGITLSFSPLNDNGDQNPLAGYIYHEPVADFGVGGPTVTDPFPQTLASDSTNTHWIELK